MRLGGPRGAARGAAINYGVGSLDLVSSFPTEMHPGNTTPRSLGSENGAITSHADMQMIEMEMIENTQAMLVEVNDLPRKGNPVSILAKELRSVLDRNELILDEHTCEKAAQWAGSIYHSALVLTTRIDHSRTTLGLVFTDDTVETVLPGGPAFMTGLRKGDAIATMSTCCSNPFCSLYWLYRPLSVYHIITHVIIDLCLHLFLQVDGLQPRWDSSSKKSSEILQKALSYSDEVGDKVSQVDRSALSVYATISPVTKCRKYRWRVFCCPSLASYLWKRCRTERSDIPRDRWT